MPEIFPKSFSGVAFAVIMGGWVLSVCAHEFGHALAAYYGGDKSVKEKGYLTFNPLKYTHSTLSILMPVVFLLFFGIGLPGGAVYINSGALRGRLWRAFVSLAGPLANMILLALMMIPFWLGYIDPKTANVYLVSLSTLAFLQVTAVIFNLLPIPPLDGFGVISEFVPKPFTRWMNRNSNVVFIVLMLSMYKFPALGGRFWSGIHAACELVGIPPELAMKGIQMMRLSIL